MKYVTKEGIEMIAVANDTPRLARADYILLSNYVLAIDAYQGQEQPDLDQVPTPPTPPPQF